MVWARRLISFSVLVVLLFSCLALVWTPQTVSAYTLRDPISINGDSMFTLENGVVGGSGSELDPYIIEGWEFDDMWDPGIEITNTEAHFVIRDVYCHVAAGTIGPDGMRFDNVRNGTVEACVISGTDKGAGISIEYCHNMSISGNELSGNSLGAGIEYSSSVDLVENNVSANRNGVTVTGSTDVHLVDNEVYGNYDPTGYEGFGVILLDSSACDIVGNAILENSGFGMMITACADCSLFSNDVSGNGWYVSWTEYGSNFDGHGIAVGSSVDLILEANSLEGNGFSVYGDTDEHFSTHTISTYNTVNGQPLRYYAFEQGVMCDSLPTGQLMVVNCTDSSFTGLDIPAAETGARIQGSDNITVSGCRISGPDAVGVGAYLNGALRLIDNECDGLFAGFSVQSFDSILVQGCSFSTDAIAINLWNGSSADVSGCTIGPASIGLSSDRVGDLRVEGCSFSDCGAGAAAYLYDSAEFVGNEFSACYRALEALCASPILVQDNRVWGNDEGIVLSLPVGAVVTGNDISDNSLCGLLLEMAEECLVYGNDFVGDSILALDTAGYMGPTTNSWDNGYPGGGNYWSNYSGHDMFSGTDQDIDGPDGIGDTPYLFAAATDRYPLMHPLGSDAPPAAHIKVGPSEGGTWTPFTFNASLTYDREDLLDALQFRWDFEGDSVWDTGWSHDATAGHVYSALGVYSARMEVIDSSGQTNVTVVQVQVLLEDDAAPTLSVSLSGEEGEEGWFVSEVVITVQASDELSGIGCTEYMVEGAVDWTTYSWPYEFSLDGAWVLDARCLDRAGNSAEDSLAFKIDRTAPATASALDGAVVSLSASDATSGVVATYYQIDDGGWALYGGPFEVEGSGSHTVEFYSVDEAGNEEDAQTLEVEVSSSAGWFNMDMWIVLLTGLIIIGISIGFVFGMRRRATESAEKAIIKDSVSAVAQMMDDKTSFMPKEEPPDEPKKDD